MTPCWYATYIKSRHEQKANDRLIRKDIETFLPLIEKWSRRKDRRKKIKVPLFPGYVFVRTLMTPYSHLEILKTDSVVKILGTDGKPTPIPAEQIHAIQVLMKDNLAVTHYPYLKEGMRVRVVNGPLVGIEGFLIKIQPLKHRLVITVDLLKEAASVEIDELDVEPIHI
ncbi:MAG: UpxY family transcription antiterminator [Deltaproteobacteria bacterium]|nr:UpxY family transcription antiterminator [Deltaproteobacteria bacterium]